MFTTVVNLRVHLSLSLMPVFYVYFREKIFTSRLIENVSWGQDQNSAHLIIYIMTWEGKMHVLY